MRWIVIIFGVVAIAFVALMLVGSNKREASGNYEPPAILGWLNARWGAPRLRDEPVVFPRDGGWTLPVPRACGTPARLATLQLLSGAYVHVAYECRTDADTNCRGPVELCREQVFCLLSDQNVPGCPSNREVVREADLSFGPEGGMLRITPALPGGATAELR